MLECVLDDYTLYSTKTHKEVRVNQEQNNAYHIEKINPKLLKVGHNGKVRNYRFNRIEKQVYRLYHSGRYIIIYDMETDLYYIKKVGTDYTIPLICEKK